MKKLTALLLILALCVPLVTPAYASARFTDVTPNDHFCSAVQFVSEQGIMIGTSSTTFAPHLSLDRAMLATLLWRMEGEPQATFRSVFSDVRGSRWYSEAITWAYDNAIVRGVGGGRFAPTNTLTRQELSGMMHRLAVRRGMDVSVPASVTVTGAAAWAVEYVRWAVHNGFIPATNPAQAATRAETAVFVYRFLNPGTNHPQPPADPSALDVAVRSGLNYHEIRRQFPAADIQTAFEQELIRLVNEIRRGYGLDPLIHNASLGRVAQLRAEELHLSNTLTHVSPSTGLEHTDHAQAMGLTASFAGENAGRGFGRLTPQSQVNGWMNSPPHRTFLLSGAAGNGFTMPWNPLIYVGVGFYNSSSHGGGWTLWQMTAN